MSSQSSFSPTANAGRNALNRFSPIGSQLNHGRSQTSTRIMGSPFYGKIDQCSTKKRISPTNVPSSGVPSTSPHSNARPTNLPFGDLQVPSSTDQDPLMAATMRVVVDPKLYQHVQHPIAYPMRTSQKDRVFATNWDEMISQEPHRARHNHVKEGVNLESNVLFHPAQQQQMLQQQQQRLNHSYEWEGPQDETLDPGLWRGNEDVQDDDDDDFALDREELFSKCYVQSNMRATEAQKERRKRHQEQLSRRKKIVKELSRENSPLKQSTGPIIIKHDVAAGDRIHPSEEGNMIWSCDSSGGGVGFREKPKFDPESGRIDDPSAAPVGRLDVRRECDKNTGTFRSKKWGAGGGGKFEPVGSVMHHGNDAASSGAPTWMTANREKRVPSTLIHHKDRCKQFELREFPLKAVSFTGIDGVNLTSLNISNDLPMWMINHREEEYPTTVVQRKEKQWSPYNQRAKMRAAEDIHKHHKLTTSGDSPSWMTEQNKRIAPEYIHEPPPNGSGIYGERTFYNRKAYRANRKMPQPHHSEIKMNTLKYTKAKQVIPIKSQLNQRVDGCVALDAKGVIAST